MTRPLAITSKLFSSCLRQPSKHMFLLSYGLKILFATGITLKRAPLCHLLAFILAIIRLQLMHPKLLSFMQDSLSLFSWLAYLSLGIEPVSKWSSGNIHIDNLRAIFLMEGVFNNAMKILLGSWMIHSAQSLNLLPDESYGSWPGCTAIQVSLTWALTADIMRQSWATLLVV